jgi:hypothetical protein
MAYGESKNDIQQCAKSHTATRKIAFPMLPKTGIEDVLKPDLTMLETGFQLRKNTIIVVVMLNGVN